VRSWDTSGFDLGLRDATPQREPTKGLLAACRLMSWRSPLDERHDRVPNGTRPL